MQIASVPPPIVTAPLAQEVALKIAASIQAVPPLVQRAVAPPPKAERSPKNRSNKDREKGSSPNDGKGEGRGGSVNIKV